MRTLSLFCLAAIFPASFSVSAATQGSDIDSGTVTLDRSLVRQAVAAYLQEHPEIPQEGSGVWIQLIGKAGAPEELRKLFNQVVAGRFSIDTSVDALNALSEAARTRDSRPAPTKKVEDPLLDPDYEALMRLMGSPEPRLQAAAAEVAGSWEMEHTANRLTELAGSSDAKVRMSAFDALRQIGGATALTSLAVLLSPDHQPEMRRKALVAIAEIRLDAAVMQSVNVLPSIENEADALETWRDLLKVKGAPHAFAVRLPRPLPPPVVAAGLKAAGEIGRPGELLVRALTQLQAHPTAEPGQ